MKIDLKSPNVLNALNYDISDVKNRFMKEHGISQSLTNQLEVELKRYLIICSYSEGVCGMRGAVDDLWHTFVIFTKNYFDFCNKLCGKYIHHTPHIQGKTKNKIVAEEDNYSKFLNTYEVVFSQRPPKHIWPEPVKVFAEQGCAGGCSNGGDCTDCTGGTTTSSDGWGNSDFNLN